ncbi:MAG TPA: hypothetical protein VFS12_02940, partial [Terriglobia bacterium]|nr:hypothetical protein [Terriglobia bacterium]
PQMLDAAKALVRNSTLLDFTYVKTHPTAGRVLAGMAGHIRPIPGMQWGRAEQQIFGKKWPVAEENSASRARRPPVRAQRGKL